MGDVAQGEIRTPGLTENWEFDVGANQTVLFDVQEITATHTGFQGLDFTLQAPDGTMLFTSTGHSGRGGEDKADTGPTLLSQPGTYSLVVDGQGDDTATYQFQVLSAGPPRVVKHSPRGETSGIADSVWFDFNQPMDTTSFSLEEDLASFTGPDGPLTANDFFWHDEDTLVVTFDPLTNLQFEMVVGPDILNPAGEPMDQNANSVAGESPGDRYAAQGTAAFTGIIYEDLVWGPELGVILVEGRLTVAEGATLTINPGTVVKFVDSFSRLQVQGTLDVLGTPEQPVFLTSIKDDTAGGDTNSDGGSTTPEPGDWAGILNSGGQSNLNHAEVRYADTAIRGTGGSVDLTNAKLIDGNRGMIVWTPFVETNSKNVVIANCFGSTEIGIGRSAS